MSALVTPDDLAGLLDRDAVVAIDVQYNLVGTPGPELYAAAHVPGAPFLDLDAARFHDDVADDLPRLEPDGRVIEAGHVIDVERDGLPIDTELSLRVRVGGQARGEFRLTAATHVARPTREQRRVAALLADQAGLALSYEGR